MPYCEGCDTAVEFRAANLRKFFPKRHDQNWSIPPFGLSLVQQLKRASAWGFNGASAIEASPEEAGPLQKKKGTCDCCRIHRPNDVPMTLIDQCDCGHDMCREHRRLATFPTGLQRFLCHCCYDSIFPHGGGDAADAQL